MTEDVRTVLVRDRLSEIAVIVGWARAPGARSAKASTRTRATREDDERGSSERRGARATEGEGKRKGGTIPPKGDAATGSCAICPELDFPPFPTNRGPGLAPKAARLLGGSDEREGGPHASRSYCKALAASPSANGPRSESGTLRFQVPGIFPFGGGKEKDQIGITSGQKTIFKLGNG